MVRYCDHAADCAVGNCALPERTGKGVDRLYGVQVLRLRRERWNLPAEVDRPRAEKRTDEGVVHVLRRVHSSGRQRQLAANATAKREVFHILSIGRAMHS